MAGVRNLCVARGTLTNARVASVVYSVPAAHVLLVKTISVMSATAETINVFWMAAGGTSYHVHTSSLVSPNFHDTWETWAAINGGDAIYLNTAGTAAIQYWISGALLPNSAPSS